MFFPDVGPKILARYGEREVAGSAQWQFSCWMLLRWRTWVSKRDCGFAREDLSALLVAQQLQSAQNFAIADLEETRVAGLRFMDDPLPGG